LVATLPRLIDAALAVVSTVIVSLPLLVNLMWTAVLEPSQPVHTDAGVIASE
jgi:hypothetical protein